MPNRVIRDALLDSEKYDALSIEARLAFFELLLRADDYGLLPLAHLWLRRHCPTFSSRSPEFADAVLSSLADQDLIRVYLVDGKRFAYIPQFGNRPQAIKPKYPMPPDSVGGAEIRGLMPTAANLRRQRINHLPPIQQGANTVATRFELRETETETETETEKKKTKRASRTPAPTAPAGVSAAHWNDWLKARKAKSLPLTETALEAVRREAAKANLTLGQAIQVAAENGWAGFKASWLLQPDVKGFKAAAPVERPKHWHETASGVQAKGAEFGLFPRNYTLSDGTGREDWHAFRQAVMDAVMKREAV